MPDIIPVIPEEVESLVDIMKLHPSVIKHIIINGQHIYFVEYAASSLALYVTFTRSERNFTTFIGISAGKVEEMDKPGMPIVNVKNYEVIESVIQEML